MIEVEYEPLPAAADPYASMQVSAPRVSDLGTQADTSEAQAHSGIAVSGTQTVTRAPNIAQEGRLTRAATSRARWPKPT